MANDDGNSAPIAAFDFAIAETLTAIGHPSGFLSGLTEYERYLRLDGIISDATNLGGRRFPNFELLASLSLQHILISPPFHANLVPRLREIADVKEYPIYNFSDSDNGHNHWEIVEELTRQLGILVNDPVASEHYIKQTNHHFDNLKSQLNSINSSLLIVRLVDDRHARVFGKGSVEGMVLSRLGLKNAWQNDMGQWGMTAVSASSLFKTDAKIIFIESSYDRVGGRRQLLSDGQWRHLPSVKQDNYVILPLNYWHWGGFPSALRFAEALVEALEAPAEPQPVGTSHH
ncbi:iron-hydroxamate transporter substrate-binding subunit [Halovibrio variabilis]|uniref:Iron-hydroxamate transporter substrate-binding subunit n=2 Tax=Halovibrio variabilis TaxID=31910 RepID=A0A511URA3_9GAMM|nr:iron-hydroxamate transporter substrate-binding subunit [Halovibrio variabilis]